MPVDISKIPERTNSTQMPVLSEYDSDWGFYTFSQTVQYEYDDIGKTGLSYATITINGFFTANAEGRGEGDSDDSSKSNALLSKYKALRGKLLSVIGKTQPSNLSEIGTSSDKRCVKLPNKLKDNLGKDIYAVPTAFATTEISPEILRYTVTLTEPKKVPCKLSIGNDIIDNASVTIICRKPRIAYRSFALSSGSEAYITGIDNRKYTISGSMSGFKDGISYEDFLGGSSGGVDSDSVGISGAAVNMISGIINKSGGKVNIKINRTSSDEKKSAFSMMITSHNVGHVLDNGMTTIDISGEECSNSDSGIGS